MNLAGDLATNTTALVTALTALVVAIGGVVGAITGVLKVLRELRQNTQLTTMGVVTGESTHSLLTDTASKSDDAALGS
jgi:putative effector of murein hydrolase